MFSNFWLIKSRLVSRNFKVSSRLKQQKSRLGLEAMMSCLGLGRLGPRSSSDDNNN